MGSSFLSEVDDTSILRTGALHRYHYPITWLSASRLLLPRSGLERSDFVLWGKAEVVIASPDFRVGPKPDHPKASPPLDRGPRLKDHVTLSELGRIDEAF